MATFRDTNGREWHLSITVRSLRLVREATGFELAKLLDDGLRRLNEVATDPELLCRVLFVLVGDQAAKHKIDADTFADGIAGDALAEAFDAFLQAFADFCPSQRRALLTTLAEKNKEQAATATAAALEALRGGTASTSPSGSPASSASTPTG